MHSMNFNLVNDLYLSYYYLIKATQLQFDWYYLECAIIIKNVISGDFGDFIAIFRYFNVF